MLRKHMVPLVGIASDVYACSGVAYCIAQGFSRTLAHVLTTECGSSGRDFFEYICLLPCQSNGRVV